MPLAKALVIRVPDRPGMLGEVATALGAKGVNIRAIHAGSEGGQGVVRMVVDAPAAARRVLAARGWHPAEEVVLEVELADRPGKLGEVASLLGQAGVDIRYVFVSTGGGRKVTVCLAVSDPKAALRALRSS
ncbi:MAG TPA: ACT domain-containing protein [Anaeromyxobacter sp.]|nr:ACT domain-containing protein [Anaeromyxobacter sp.]